PPAAMTANPAAPSKATPPAPLFVAPTVEPQKKPAAMQPLPLPPEANSKAAAAPVSRTTKPAAQQHAAAKPKPVARHAKPDPVHESARVRPRRHSPYYAGAPEPEPPMPPPGWYDRGPGSGYPYPGPPYRMGYW